MNQIPMSNIEETPSGSSINAEVGNIPPVKNRLSHKNKHDVQSQIDIIIVFLT